jgi:hypothetical protein
MLQIKETQRSKYFELNIYLTTKKQQTVSTLLVSNLLKFNSFGYN